MSSSQGCACSKTHQVHWHLSSDRWNWAENLQLPAVLFLFWHKLFCLGQGIILSGLKKHRLQTRHCTSLWTLVKPTTVPSTKTFSVFPHSRQGPLFLVVFSPPHKLNKMFLEKEIHGIVKPSAVSLLILNQLTNGWGTQRVQLNKQHQCILTHITPSPFSNKSQVTKGFWWVLEDVTAQCKVQDFSCVYAAVNAAWRSWSWRPWRFEHSAQGKWTKKDMGDMLSLSTPWALLG